jgi:AraC-like DNA-binding protein
MHVALTDIQGAIKTSLGKHRGASAYLVARSLFCSESTLHRTLRRYGTTFAIERNRIRVVMAIELLTAGRSVASVARRVDVSPDYLRRLIVAEVGMTPVQITQAATLAQQLAELPRTYGELSERPNAERRLDDLVGDLPAGHPLAAWAKNLMRRTYLPEIETTEFFAELRLRHQEARAARRDASDLRHLEQGLMDVELPRPLTPEEEEINSLARAEMYASWRRRLRNYRRLEPK